MEETKNTIQEQVLEKIQQEHIHQKPKWHFVLHALLTASAIVLAAAILLCFVSLAVFNARRNGSWYVPGFGTSALLVVAPLLPWKLIGLSIAFLAVVQLLIRRYSPLYHQPLLYSGIALVSVALAAGYFIAPLHARILKSIRQNQLPLAAPFYRQFAPDRLENVERGMIIATTTQGFIIKNNFGATSSIIIDTKTRMMSEKVLEYGDTIIIFTPEKRMGKKPFGIRRIIDPDFDGDF